MPVCVPFHSRYYLYILFPLRLLPVTVYVLFPLRLLPVCTLSTPIVTCMYPLPFVTCKRTLYLLLPQYLYTLLMPVISGRVIVIDSLLNGGWCLSKAFETLYDQNLCGALQFMST